MSLSLTSAIAAIAFSALAQSPMTQSNFYVAVRSVFEVCPLSMNRQLDLADAQSIARFGLRPRDALPGFPQAAEGRFPDGSVIVARASGPICVVQFSGDGFEQVREAVIDQLSAAGWSRASDTRSDGGRHETYLLKSGQPDVSFRVQLIANPTSRSVMVKSDHLRSPS